MISPFRPQLSKPKNDKLRQICGSLCFWKEEDQYTVISITNDTGIDSSAVQCGASAGVLWAPYQLLYCVLVLKLDVART